MPRGKQASVQREQGFTMVELVITMVVAAILFAVAIPNFSNLINSNRLTTGANALIGALNTARMEAIKRNGSVQFCSNLASTNTTDTLGSACATNAGAVFVLTGTTTTSTLLAAPAALSIPSIQVRSVAAIRFNGTGVGYAPGSTTPFGSGTGNTVVELCSTALKTNNDIQVTMATGSIITSLPPTTVASCP
ncbi:GspH/FimT family pseudopilin [Dyella japonica]|uniref:GspH/FimT family pseudopilin n=1 Tax=Dyella japonica TaxID=231455 RepID=UPI001B807DCB|nr:GspH/FimT family pseudopilin [Dyella japonica]